MVSTRESAFAVLVKPPERVLRVCTRQQAKASYRELGAAHDRSIASCNRLITSRDRLMLLYNGYGVAHYNDWEARVCLPLVYSIKIILVRFEGWLGVVELSDLDRLELLRYLIIDHFLGQRVRWTTRQIYVLQLLHLPTKTLATQF